MTGRRGSEVQLPLASCGPLHRTWLSCGTYLATFLRRLLGGWTGGLFLIDVQHLFLAQDPLLLLLGQALSRKERGTGCSRQAHQTRDCPPNLPLCPPCYSPRGTAAVLPHNLSFSRKENSVSWGLPPLFWGSNLSRPLGTGCNLLPP